MVVREDSLTLYGFASADEREFFELLLTATGVGPKLAQTALAGVAAYTAIRFASNGKLGPFDLVAVDGEAVVGLAWAIITRALDRAAYLRLLLVSEEHQSQGVGAALLARVEREARASRCRHLVLLVTKTNRRARSFYERHGYAHVGDLAGFVHPGIAESLYLKSWRT